MNKPILLSKERTFILHLTIAFFVAFLILLILIQVPQIYNFFVGEETIEKHLSESNLDRDNPTDVALYLMDWASENIKYPSIEEKKLLLVGGTGFYKINNETRFFIRNGPASWTIKTKLARCGESAIYFVETMGYLGFKAKTVHPKGWDHVWAEYYTLEGNKVTVDPSANKIILNKSEWVEGRNVTQILTKDRKGNKEDITSEYLGGLN